MSSPKIFHFLPVLSKLSSVSFNSVCWSAKAARDSLTFIVFFAIASSCFLIAFSALACASFVSSSCAFSFLLSSLLFPGLFPLPFWLLLPLLGRFLPCLVLLLLLSSLFPLPLGRSLPSPGLLPPPLGLLLLLPGRSLLCPGRLLPLFVPLSFPPLWLLLSWLLLLPSPERLPLPLWLLLLLPGRSLLFPGLRLLPPSLLLLLPGRSLLFPGLRLLPLALWLLPVPVAKLR